jgi:hypothetical protein
MALRQLNPARNVQNGNDLRVPPHHFASIKRLPIFTFPQAWNDEEEKRGKNHPVAEVIQKTA